MQAILCKDIGEPNVLTIVEMSAPIPSPNQLLVRVKAAALNRADILQRRGKHPPPPGESSILGLEIAGEITEIGKNVSDFKIGERVFGLVGSGGYAEYCVIDAHTALPIPENISFIEAAAIPEAFLTANEALFTLGLLTSNESVLIHAGGSGVGSAAIQLAKQMNTKIFTTVGQIEKINKVKALGADVVIPYKNTDFVEAIEKEQGKEESKEQGKEKSKKDSEEQNKEKGIDVIIDFIGAKYLAQHLALLKTTGRLICVGMMGGTKTDIDLNTLIKKRLQIKGLVMRSRSLEDKRFMTQHFAQKWLPFLRAGKIHPVVDSVFAFNEVQAAHAYMESNANVGKIILQI